MLIIDIFLLSVLVPALSPVLDFFGIEIFPAESTDFFASIVTKALELRKQEEGQIEVKLMINDV